MAVVAPVPSLALNPRVVPPYDEQWVVYPWIAGARYTGAKDEIAASGHLLGQIHACDPAVDFGLKTYITVRPFTADEMRNDAETIMTHVGGHAPEKAVEAQRLLDTRMGQYVSDVLPRVQRLTLPLVSASWDHKAANLVFPTPTSPVLIDPDNAARMPRLYDLAMTALTFHLDLRLHDGPARLLTAEEWQTFLDGYRQQITLTSEECAVWPDLLLCAWMDEAIWQLQDGSEGWGDPRGRQMLLDLLELPHAFLL
ncbi:hypothetical protein GCM10008957_47170 [Deinococcus ruber]|uniref:Aminoglycoside phosphotransferase domain-containing protein n=1 Tax=Deinococcus ruber TaxID=1848197 RepID=A0A918CMW3_9DEIO|nr:hypothetical protein GCM10008957_47170 [Deinococcus ruber]